MKFYGKAVRTIFYLGFLVVSLTAQFSSDVESLFAIPANAVVEEAEEGSNQLSSLESLQKDIPKQNLSQLLQVDQNQEESEEGFQPKTMIQPMIKPMIKPMTLVTTKETLPIMTDSKVFPIEHQHNEGGQHPVVEIGKPTSLLELKQRRARIPNITFNLMGEPYPLKRVMRDPITFIRKVFRIAFRPDKSGPPVLTHQQENKLTFQQFLDHYLGNFFQKVGVPMPSDMRYRRQIAKTNNQLHIEGNALTSSQTTEFHTPPQSLLQLQGTTSSSSSFITAHTVPTTPQSNSISPQLQSRLLIRDQVQRAAAKTTSNAGAQQELYKAFMKSVEPSNEKYLKHY